VDRARDLRARRLSIIALIFFVAPACAHGVVDGGDDSSSGGGGDDASASTTDGAPQPDGAGVPAPDGSPVDAPADGVSGHDGGPDGEPHPDASPPADAAEDVAVDARVDATADGRADAGADAATEEASADASADVASDVPSAGCTCGARSVCVTGSCTPARRVFVSSKTYDGKLGGHTGADGTCQALATAANLGGTWMAWISDSSSSPNRRFSKATVAYRLLDGRLVAASWTALASGNSLGSAIDLDETGASLAGSSGDSSKTWTATATDGTTDTANCNDFAANASSASGEVGDCTSVTNSWTVAIPAEGCSATHHLYCFEQ
jgi:hypothetical protein